MIRHSREALAWAAGFYEGEGSATAWSYRSEIRVRLEVAQQTVEPLAQFERAIGPLGSVQPSGGGRCHSYVVVGFPRVQAVAAMLWPWLSARRRRQLSAALGAYMERRRQRGYARPYLRDYAREKKRRYDRQRMANVRAAQRRASA